MEFRSCKLKLAPQPIDTVTLVATGAAINWHVNNLCEDKL